MARRAGGPPSITHGHRLYPLGGAEPPCAPPGLAGGLTPALGWCWWPRSRVGTHVLWLGNLPVFALGRWAGEAPDV